ncbi:MAG: M48 family metalloprotease [Longimicrobiales bacterium]
MTKNKAPVLSRRTLKASAALLLLGLATGCARNPVTGAREFVLISESQEIALGQEASRQVEASIGLVDDGDLQAYVRRIGQRLAAASERPNLPWKFGVVDDPTPNAFALPGGPIYITRGLLSLMDTEAELASVLGHEIGHITARHAVTQMSRAQVAQLGLGLGMIFVPELSNLGGALSSGLQLMFLKYGRDDERQSDDLGFKYAQAANYDVREMDDVFASLARASELEGNNSPLPSWLSSHPAPEERIQRIAEKIAALPAISPGLVTNRTEYLNQIDELIYGTNPRQGFFRDTEFLHPELRFRLSFPSGWKTQNLPHSVMAGSPSQDAAMELTLTNGSPNDAATRFFGQQGIQVAGPLSRESVNGLPAVMGYFSVRTQQGDISGLALFLQHGGTTYQLLAYTPAGRLQSYDRAFRATAGSFATLTDPQALNVRPNRIDVVRLSSPTTLTEFNRRNPSAIPINELALINQVQDPNATLATGTSVKRVSAS